MLGAQLGYDSPWMGNWKFDSNLAYYHYDLGSIAGADSGDFRSNLLDANGQYLSDFHLANVLFGVTYAGLGDEWPLRLNVDHVRNTGAATDADTGYSAELSLGKAAVPGDWRFAYGYSMAQTDAVLAAFSHDNIGIGTNYRLHALTVDYVPLPKTMLSLYWYHYRPYSRVYPVGHEPDDWLDRLLESDAAKRLIEPALKKLTPAQQLLIDALFYKEMSAREYADSRGLDETTVSLTKKAAIKKLKKFLKP